MAMTVGAGEVEWSGATVWWEETGNWVGGQVPAVTDTAVFTGTTAVRAGSRVADPIVTASTIAAVLIEKGTVTYGVDANESETLYVTERLVIGALANESAQLTLQRRGSLIVTNAAGTAVFKVGEAGQGALVVNIFNPSHTRRVDWLIATNTTRLAFGQGSFVIGKGSTIDMAGDIESYQERRWLANLTLEDGAHEWKSNLLNLGSRDTDGYRGTFRVTGANTVLNNYSDVQMRFLSTATQLTAGDARIEVINGGQMNVHGHVSLGNQGLAGTDLGIYVNGANSALNISSNVTMGYLSVDRSQTHLTVADNGRVAIGGNLWVGTGEATITNLVRVTSGGTLAVTNAAGTAKLNVIRGSLTVNNGTLTANHLVATNGAAGALTFSQGEIRLTHGAEIANGSTFTVGNGTDAATLRLALGGTYSFANDLQISENATLRSAGLIQGAVTVAGTLRPGNSVGTATFEDDLTLTSTATLWIDILGNPSSSDYDRIILDGGALTLDGMLQVSLTGSYALGTKWTILSGATRTGTFADDSSATSQGLQVNYLSDGFELEVIPEPGSLLLLLAGLVMLCGWRVRANRS